MIELRCTTIKSSYALKSTVDYNWFVFRIPLVSHVLAFLNNLVNKLLNMLAS